MSVSPPSPSSKIPAPPGASADGAAPGVSGHPRRWPRRLLVFASFAVLLPVFHHFAAEKARRDNTGVTERGYDVIFDYDQQPYLNVARKLRDENFRWVTPRHRMPGYSLLLAPLYDPETAHEIDPHDPEGRRVSDGYFERAKKFTILLALGVLVGLYFFSRRWMPVAESLLVTWAFALLLAVFKAPYVQPEVIFYFTFTMAFVLLLRQLEQPGWVNGILAGAALAATFILKSAVMPLILLFVACFLLKQLVDFFLAARQGERPQWGRAFRRLLQGAVPVLVFVALLSPYLINTWKHFGSPFWDAHSRHYMWMDTAEEKTKWRGLEISEPHFQPPLGEEAPSFYKYVREHTLAEAAARPAEGWRVLMLRVRKDYASLYRFATDVCLLVVIVIAALHWREVRDALRRHWAAALMVGGFFFGYGLLYSWYAAIGVGPRLILGLFLPAAFAALWFVGRFGGVTRIPRLGWRIDDGRVAGAILAVAIGVFGWRVLDRELWAIEGGH